MRRRQQSTASDYRIIVVDDEIGIIESLSVVLGRSGYDLASETDPNAAIERIRAEHFDLLVLDFLMAPLHGDEVVARIREFDKEIYILLLTGYRDLAPPLETIKALDIQGYCEKSDKFDQLVLLVESGIKSIAMMRTIKKFQEGLNRILQAVPKIYQLQPLGGILEEILAELLPLVDSENAFILIDDPTGDPGDRKSIFRGIGTYRAEVTEFVDMLAPSLMEEIGRARMSRELVRTDEGLILPLSNELLQSIGVIFVEASDETATPAIPADQGARLLEIYANQAASSLSNAFLHSLVNTKNEELARTYEQLHVRYMDTIEALRLAVDAKDIYTRGHSDRVAYYAGRVGRRLALPDEQRELLRIAGVFHDVGKIGTADDILTKAERLSGDEYAVIKKHPLKGAQILSAISMFREVVPIVQCHHERIDGKGYPQGLAGDRIPFLSRIIAVVDAFDAMTSDRQYREHLELDDAVEQLRQGRGSQFDAACVDAFLEELADYAAMKKEMAALNIGTDILDAAPSAQGG